MERFSLLLIFWCCMLSVYGGGLRLVAQWNELEYVFPDQGSRVEAVAKQFYAPGLAIPPIDVDVYYGKGPSTARIFVTVPRWEPGRPVTLGTVGAAGRLLPYPDYSWHDHQGANCDGMTSVFRIAIDRCHRLWVLDNGAVGSNRTCPPQLLAFDLERERLLYRHRVAERDYFNSIYVTPVVDIRGTDAACADTFVYAADVRGNGLLVVDVARDRSWKVTHRLFYPCPYWGVFNIDGESFELMDGVLGLALSPETTSRDRLLYFHALASAGEGVLSANALRNRSSVLTSEPRFANILMLPGLRATQSAAEAMDRNGILFFGSMEPPAVYCWNSATEFSQKNFHQVAVSRDTLQFAGGMKVVENARGEQELWVLASSLQRYLAGSLSAARPNFFLHAEKISNLLRDSPCLYPNIE